VKALAEVGLEQRVELRVLGNPELRVDGHFVPIKAAKVRAFTAALTVRQGRAVGSSRPDGC
jgi:DNA-binding SARP family transcriptional activator